MPSVDAELDKCAPLDGEPARTCYAALDQQLTTQIVPWVPYLWRDQLTVVSKDVTKWTFDQFGGTLAYAHVAVK